MTELYTMVWFWKQRPQKTHPSLERFPSYEDTSFTLDGFHTHDRVFVLPRGSVDWKAVKNAPKERSTVGLARRETRPLKIFVGPRPFGFVVTGDDGLFRQAQPVPCDELARHLTVEEIKRLQGKIPDEAYAELLGAKLRET
jgi:hypothetical protein